MGPQKAAKIFAAHHPEARTFKTILYGSLAATGKGHMTDVAVTEVLSEIAPITIEWRPTEVLPFHPNGMRFEVTDAAGGEVGEPTAWIVYSVGGGALVEEGQEQAPTPDVY